MFALKLNGATFSRQLMKVQRGLDVAQAIALTKTAKDGQGNVSRGMARRFDRPTAFTVKGIAILPANRGKLKATVYVKAIQGRYLQIMEEGGVSKPKGRALLTPANVKLNRYGNLTRNKFRQLMARKDTFSGTINGWAGLWQRKRGGGLSLLIRYDDKREYTARFGFRDSVQKTAISRFPYHWDKERAKTFARFR